MDVIQRVMQVSYWHTSKPKHPAEYTFGYFARRGL